jgi:translation initiation factor 2 beta subunit (eIF-2beta)/eIF-5
MKRIYTICALYSTLNRIHSNPKAIYFKIFPDGSYKESSKKDATRFEIHNEIDNQHIQNIIHTIKTNPKYDVNWIFTFLESNNINITGFSTNFPQLYSLLKPELRTAIKNVVPPNHKIYLEITRDTWFE